MDDVARGYLKWFATRPKDIGNLTRAALENLRAGEPPAQSGAIAWEDSGRKVNFIYNFKRGYFYPFVPTGDKQRDTESELRLKAQLQQDLPIEPELERWFPLWDAPV